VLNEDVYFSPLAKVGVLERFSNPRGVTKAVQGGFFFHPMDEDLSMGTPVLRKKPLEASGFPLHQLENRYTGYETVLLFTSGPAMKRSAAAARYKAKRTSIWASVSKKPALRYP
jgi:hypothetical protein